jgi:hypothetical protein
MPIVPQTQNSTQPDAASGGSVPFMLGTNSYAEQISTDTFQLGATAQEFVHNITPGGYLRGVDLQLTSAGGTTGSLTADAPYNLLNSVSLENIDGSPILYPMGGYAYAMWQKFSAPWLGEPSNPAQLYSTGQGTPGFFLHLYPEIYGTAGVLANTDARAQYRVRYTLSPATTVGTGYTVTPTVTAVCALQTWAQPDRQDLHGNTIQAQPPGLNLARIVRHQVLTLNGAGATNLIQVTNTGNEIRNIIIIIRDQTNARVDGISGVLRLRLDDRSLGTYTPNTLFDRAVKFFPNLGNNTFPRPTGVYCIPRYQSPTPDNGTLLNNDAWLATSNATFLNLEFVTAAGPTGGTVEVITDEVVPVGSIPLEIEGA